MTENFFIVGGLAFVVMLLLYVWTAVALSALFRKAGEAGWQAWVPGYNSAIVLRLGGFSPWLVFVAFVPLFGWIAYPVLHFISCHRIGRAFGHGGAMTVLAVLFPVWATVLGYGSSRWIGSEHAASRRASPAPVAPAESAPPLLGPWDPPAPQGPTTPAFPVAAPAAPPLASGFWAPPAVDTPSSAFPAAEAAASVPPPLPPVPPLPSVVPAAPAEAPSVTSVPPLSRAASLPGMPPAALPETRREYRGDLAEGDDDAVDPEDRVAADMRPSATFLPPDAPAHAAPPAPAPVAPIESVPLTRPTPEPQETRPLPVSSVPEAPEVEPLADPWAPASASARPAPEDSAEDLPELSEAVSAVAGAPDAGSPRSARSSVSALYAQEQPEEEDEAFDHTIVARRRRIPWTLVPPGAPPVEITSDVVILGRRPTPDAARPGAQLIAIADETRTVSKTHARLELREDTWYVTDLGSTNGVLFATLMGTEVEAPPGQELEAGERFFLGDAEVRLKRSDA